MLGLVLRLVLGFSVRIGARVRVGLGLVVGFSLRVGARFGVSFGV